MSPRGRGWGGLGCLAQVHEPQEQRIRGGSGHLVQVLEPVYQVDAGFMSPRGRGSGGAWVTWP